MAVTREELAGKLLAMSAIGEAKPWLVLVGGGAKGRWQAGAIETCHRLGLLTGIKGIIGTSVGGLNACLYSIARLHDDSAAMLRGIWQERVTCNASIYTPDLPKSVFGYIKMAPRIFSESIVDTKPLRALMLDVCGTVSAGDIGNALKYDLVTVAYDYAKCEPKTCEGYLYDMGLSTSAIEGLFPAHQGCGDGGLLVNNGVELAIERGATHVLVIFCGPERNPEMKDWKPGVIKNLQSALEGLLAAGEENAWKDAMQAQAQGRVRVLGLWPDTDTGDALNFANLALFDTGAAEADKNLTVERLAAWID